MRRERRELIFDEAHELGARLRDAEQRGFDAETDDERDESVDFGARVESGLELALVDSGIEIRADRPMPSRRARYGD